MIPQTASMVLFISGRTQMQPVVELGLLLTQTHLLSCTSWMFSMPMALLRRELKGPDFFLVGLFPGMIRD